MSLNSSFVGHSQCHEHIFLEKGASYRQNPALCLNEKDASLAELNEYYEAGGRLIVDAQPYGYGRNANVLCELSKKSGVKIVAVTGFHKKEFLDETWILDLSKREIEKLYTDEIKIGMLMSQDVRTAYKASIVKAAYTKDCFTDPIYQRMITAVANTAAKTGVPLMVHTEKNTDIEELLDFLTEEGVKRNQVIICHLDRTNPSGAYHKKVLSLGCYLCYDSVNRLKYVSHEEEIALIKEMIDAGYVKQILLSLDTTADRLRAYNAKDMGLDYILKIYIPMLKEHGISDRDIEYMCVKNAQEVLSGK
ncbi:TatD family hydrolase [Lachnospiraceae bacterium ZAX-1]